MFLIRQIKVKPDDVPEILAKEKEQICSNINSSIIAGVFVEPTFGADSKDL